MKRMAKTALKILEYLLPSDEVFDEVCAKDVDVDDYVLFREQLDVLYEKDCIEVPPRSISEIDLSTLNFVNKIKSVETKVKIGLTVEGALLIPKLRAILNHPKA